MYACMYIYIYIYTYRNKPPKPVSFDYSCPTLNAGVEGSVGYVPSGNETAIKGCYINP